MSVAIIDADLIYKSKHRFPNLACMKISAFEKSVGNSVSLKTDYNDLDLFSKVYISKVFTDTVIPQFVLELPNVSYGGTGFFYDKAPPLPDEIEHIMPDYNLYNDWINSISSTDDKQFEYYTNYSIGFLTRKCFRGCYYCVNKNYKKVEEHSPLSEFYDKTRKYICLLDDNFFGLPLNKWKPLLQDLIDTNRFFQFKQGLDERLLTPDKCEMLANCKYKGDYIFAFDQIKDAHLIESKLELWRKYTNKTTKLYVFCGADEQDKYDLDFWKRDINDVFERIKILMKYNCIPYLMRFNRYVESPFYGTYVNLSRWCNQPNFFKKMSYRQFCVANKNVSKGKCACYDYMTQIENEIPEVARKFFDMKFEFGGNNE